MTQADLLSYRPPAVRSSPTSRAAAESMVVGVGTVRAAVLEWLRVHGPATDEQMQEGIPMRPSTQRPRRVELVAAGWSGREMTIWRAVR